MNQNEPHAELHAIASRYAERRASGIKSRYSWLRPEVCLAGQERERVILEFLRDAGLGELSALTLLEIGCGGGANLLRFLQWGFDPANLAGNELLPERVRSARRQLPSELRLYSGDACTLDCGPFDIVFQSLVFSSVLDDAMRARLAERMWAMTRPGGGVLWYDFCYDNPGNDGVRGVPLKTIRALFPHAEPVVRRVTLAPPISRMVTRASPRLHFLFHSLPLLRTHLLCWLPKPVHAGPSEKR